MSQRRLPALLLALLMLVACGQKGPLHLPEPEERGDETEEEPNREEEGSGQ